MLNELFERRKRLAHHAQIHTYNVCYTCTRKWNLDDKLFGPASIVVNLMPTK